MADLVNYWKGPYEYSLKYGIDGAVTNQIIWSGYYKWNWETVRNYGLNTFLVEKIIWDTHWIKIVNWMLIWYNWEIRFLLKLCILLTYMYF